MKFETFVTIIVALLLVVSIAYQHFKLRDCEPPPPYTGVSSYGRPGYIGPHAGVIATKKRIANCRQV